MNGMLTSKVGRRFVEMFLLVLVPAAGAARFGIEGTDRGDVQLLVRQRVQRGEQLTLNRHCFFPSLK